MRGTQTVSENVKPENSVVGKLFKEMIEYDKEQINTFNPSHTFKSNS
jgi:hypothetical protein